MLANEQSLQYLEYRVKSGDTLAYIISRFYDVAPGSNEYRYRIAQIIKLNPHITNPDRIYAGDFLILAAESGTEMCMAEDKDKEVFSPPLPPLVLPSVPVDSDADFWALSWLANHSNYLVLPGSTLLGAKSNLLSGGNIGLVENVSDLYAEYKAGKISKPQYDYQRKKSLDLLRKNIGPFEKLLYGDKTPHQVVRIARGGAIPATARIAENAQHLKKLASLAKSGGVVLTGVGVAASCMQIADAPSTEEKSRILVETVASTGAGIGSSALIGLFLISNPVGWGTALVLATGSVALSYASGKGARMAYDVLGNRIDLVSGTGVDAVCRRN